MYTPISIKDAVKKVNEEWFLPAIQRPYVWGNRYESEKYICRLFDSMYQEYPIGVLILWNAKNKKVAHREFLRDFHSEDIYNNVPSTLWSRPKSLVYDGQQRLQTISSCLKHTFNNRILVFDLLYKEPKDFDLDNETGFRFVDTNDDLRQCEIAMNTLFYCPQTEEEKVLLENRYQRFCQTDEEHFTVRTNIGKLWKAFVDDGYKELLAFYEISESRTEERVNEIFERLNTGGIQLSKTDLLYSKIKEKYPDFEADIMAYTKQPRNILLNHYDFLQLLHLMVKKQSRISEKVKVDEIDKIVGLWKDMKRPLDEFFDSYLQEHLHINDISIVRSKLPLFVIIIFLYRNYKEKKNAFNRLGATQLKLIDKFFITAELNDWTLQSYTDHFAEIVLDNKTPEIFPWNEIVEYVQDNRKRNVEISEEIFCAYRWFSLKILTPKRIYFSLSEKSTHRYNPELDHIFPKKLSVIPPGVDRSEYERKVDVIWNLQPVTGDINNQKRKKDPLEYFKSDEGKNELGKYDFVPSNLEDPLWKDPFKFVEWRREQMLKLLKAEYDIELIPKPETKN